MYRVIWAQAGYADLNWLSAQYTIGRVTNFFIVKIDALGDRLLLIVEPDELVELIRRVEFLATDAALNQ